MGDYFRFRSKREANFKRKQGSDTLLGESSVQLEFRIVCGVCDRPQLSDYALKCCECSPLSRGGNSMYTHTTTTIGQSASGNTYKACVCV